MKQLLTIVVALAPALFWLSWFYERDKLEPEPKRLVLRAFLLGGLSTIPAALLEQVLPGAVPEDNAAFHIAIVAAFLVIAPIEELTKFLAVRLSVYRHAEFDEPMDGILYAASAALGFAAFENVGYVIEYGPSVMVLRAVFSTLGHALFAVPWGLALGLRRCVAGTGAWVVPAGLGVAMLLHGAFDALLFTGRNEAIVVFLGVLFPAMVWSGRAALRHVVPLSPYLVVAYCRQCGNELIAAAQFCSDCGTAIVIVAANEDSVVAIAAEIEASPPNPAGPA